MNIAKIADVSGDTVSRGGRLPVPNAGRTIYSAARRWMEPFSITFNMLMKSALAENRQETLCQRYRETFSPIIKTLDMTTPFVEKELRLLNSAILCEWMLCRVANPDIKMLSFEDAERWFLGDANSIVPGLVLNENDWIPAQCMEELRDLPFDADFIDLMPYILELFDNVTDCGTIPDRQFTRAMKRKSGVVYTPSDLADFIVNQAFESHVEEAFESKVAEGKFGVLDPACGTGIFLRSALDIMRNILGSEFSIWDSVKCLYGMDVNHQAIQSCSFALVGHCLGELTQVKLSPWRAWQVIRGNLAVVDSTLINHEHNGRKDSASLAQLRIGRRNELLALLSPERLVSLPKSNADLESANRGPSKLEDIFPEFSDGFSVVVGNPPYSRLPWDSYVGVRAAHFRTAPSSQNYRSSKYYPLFIEMIWQLSKPELSSGGMVVPLSIAYSTSSPIQHLRAAIEETPGKWRFAFFDRTPDSLFGDDVKTRNAVILWSHGLGTSASHIFTGPLLRWNSRNRRTLFERIGYIPLDRISIRDFIPKIGSHLESILYNRIYVANKKFMSFLDRPHINETGSGSPNDRFVFYSATAYNWIPVFRTASIARNNMRPSLRVLDCGNDRYAWFVFACLVSRVTYWLWRIEGDGFHITKEFIDRLPFDPLALSEDHFEHLLLLAKRMWARMQENPVESVNKGKRTISYYPYMCESELDAIDAILLDSLGLPETYTSFLKKFVTDNIMAGRYDELQTNEALRRLRIKESRHD